MKSAFLPKFFSLVCALALTIGMVGVINLPVKAAGTISLTALGTAYTQDFNTLEYRLATTSSTTPLGWGFVETGTLANSTYLTSSGVLSLGDTYSFGAVGNTERAFGGLRGTLPTLTPTIGASFTNNTGGTITSLAIAYTGEEWRLGAASRTDRLDFQISTDATSLSTGSWSDQNALDFTTPVTSGTGAKNGNVSPNRTAISYTITGLSIADGSTFWVRWQDYDTPATTTCLPIIGCFSVDVLDDGLAVDDFSLTPAGFMPDTAPSVSTIVPADAATGVAMDSDVVITFSEAVDVAASWVSLSCSASGIHTSVVTGGPIAYTLNPDVNFSANETCTVTVSAADVTDQDTNDPPEAMAADFVSTFSVADAAPSVTGTSPADGDTDILIDRSITVDFSEDVTVTESSFTLTCATSGVHALSVSGSGSSTITLDPTVNFAHSEVCTLTVLMDNVSDVDAFDPPNGMAADFSMSFTTTEPAPYVSSFTPSNALTLIDVKIHDLVAVFNKDVLHDGGEFAADNLDNYLLVEQGLNNLFDTLTCEAGVQGDDLPISIDSVVYNPLTFTATLGVNGGVFLPEGDYRLFVCGTSSIHDLVGNTLNDGQFDAISDFDIRFPRDAATLMPATGFAPDRVTDLPAQTVSYDSLGDFWLEIPSLKVKTAIVGVPQTGDTWDVTWLGSQAGWLEGSAYPTSLGNSVLTAHVWDALNKPGAFYALDKLGYGDRVIVHSHGKTFTYAVRRVMTVAPWNVDAMLKHQDDAWLTLVTCKGFVAYTDQYAYRTLIRAVLVDVK